MRILDKFVKGCVIYALPTEYTLRHVRNEKDMVDVYKSLLNLTRVNLVLLHIVIFFISIMIGLAVNVLGGVNVKIIDTILNLEIIFLLVHMIYRVSQTKKIVKRMSEDGDFLGHMSPENRKELNDVAVDYDKIVSEQKSIDNLRDSIIRDIHRHGKLTTNLQHRIKNTSDVDSLNNILNENTQEIITGN